METLQSLVRGFAHSALLIAPVMAILTVLELAFPRTRCSGLSRLRSAVFWIPLLLVTVATYKALGALWNSLGVTPLVTLQLGRWSAWAGPAGPYLAALAALLITDFFGYWYHRLQHGPLWRFHSVHHSVRELNAISSYSHITDPAFQFLAMTVPMSLIPFDAFTQPLIITIFVRFQTGFIHSPTRLHYGWLGLLFTDNRYHRIHHSLEERHFEKNFGVVTTIWDRVFGTAYFPKGDEWPATGLADAPEPESVGAYLFRPFLSRTPAGSSRQSGALPIS